MSENMSMILYVSYFILFGGFVLLWAKTRRLARLLDDTQYEIGMMEKDLDWQCEKIDAIIDEECEEEES